jgi:hypothetical protein
MLWATTIYQLTMALVILCVTVFIPNHLYARDDGRFANSPLKEWFDRLASRNGLCCDFADGVSVQDVDWGAQEGHYRVRIHGQWLVVLWLSRETPRPVQHLSPA